MFPHTSVKLDMSCTVLHLLYWRSKEEGKTKYGHFLYYGGRDDHIATHAKLLNIKYKCVMDALVILQRQLTKEYVSAVS